MTDLHHLATLWRTMARLRSSAVIVAGPALAVAIACASPATLRPIALLTDPGGCQLEQVTDAGPDNGHFQFGGPDRMHRFLVVGTYRGDSAGAYILDLVTGTRRPLPGINNAGRFSRDGQRVLVATRDTGRSPDLVELDVASLSRRVIAPHQAGDWLGSYSPDGRSILFNSYRSGRSDLYLLPDSATEPRRLTSFDGYDAHGSWAPDQRRIAFHREVSRADYDIFVIDLRSGLERTLVEGNGEQAYPAWSPDGRTIAFASDAGNSPGQLDIVLTDTTGRASHRLTRHPGYNTYPAWSADGRWIYFNSERNGKRNVFRIRLDETGQCPVARR